MTITCHASHEQFYPFHLLQLSVLAEKHGFDAIHSSDHLQATTLLFSTLCAPGQRYHPAIAAQAIATLAEMFPDVSITSSCIMSTGIRNYLSSNMADGSSNNKIQAGLDQFFAKKKYLKPP